MQTLVGNVHLVQGGAEKIPALKALLAKQKIVVAGNPDAYVRAYAHFGIDEAREIRERSATRAVGERKVFIIAAPGITNEAQNALLKTLEEPHGGALFFLIVPSPHALLPTLRSRSHMLVIDADMESAVDVRAFLKAAPAKRLDMLKPLLEKGDDDRRDLGAIAAFLSSLEMALAQTPQKLPPVYRARKYIADKGALVKPLLEQVALLV